MKRLINYGLWLDLKTQSHLISVSILHFNVIDRKTMFSLLKQLQPTLTEVTSHKHPQTYSFQMLFCWVWRWRYEGGMSLSACSQAEFEARFKRLDNDASGVVGSPESRQQPRRPRPVIWLRSSSTSLYDGADAQT